MNAAVLDVIYVLLGLCTLLLLLGSGLIFMGFMKYPDLRTGPNFLIIPVQLASILFVFTNTISRLSFAFPKIILGEETCQILRSVMYTMTTLPGMLLAFIGLQRYLIFVKHKTLFSGHLANAVAFLIIFGQNIGTAYFFRFRMQQLKGEYNTTAIDTNSTMYYMISKKSALFRICPYRGQIYSELMPSAAILTLVALKLVLPMILQFFCYTQIWRVMKRKELILRNVKQDSTTHGRRAIQRELMLHRSWIGIFITFILCFIPYMVILGLQEKMSVEVLSLVVTAAMVGSSSHGFIYVMLHTGFRKMLPRCRSTRASSTVNTSTKSSAIDDDEGLKEVEFTCVRPIPQESTHTSVSVIAK